MTLLSIIKTSLGVLCIFWTGTFSLWHSETCFKLMMNVGQPHLHPIKHDLFPTSSCLSILFRSCLEITMSHVTCLVAHFPFIFRLTLLWLTLCQFNNQLEIEVSKWLSLQSTLEIFGCVWEWTVLWFGIR